MRIDPTALGEAGEQRLAVGNGDGRNDRAAQAAHRNSALPEGFCG